MGLVLAKLVPAVEACRRLSAQAAKLVSAVEACCSSSSQVFCCCFQDLLLCLNVQALLLLLKTVVAVLEVFDVLPLRFDLCKLLVSLGVRSWHFVRCSEVFLFRLGARLKMKSSNFLVLLSLQRLFLAPLRWLSLLADAGFGLMRIRLATSCRPRLVVLLRNSEFLNFPNVFSSSMSVVKHWVSLLGA